LLLGPIDGLVVGGVGSFIYQLFFSGYGITVTTFLWILPHTISGLIAGLYAKYKKFTLSFSQTCFIVIISNLLVTTLNTLALYVDSRMFGYYSKMLVFGSLGIKVIVGIILAIIYSLTIPKLSTLIKKYMLIREGLNVDRY
jgi:uncharacterized membrane protein